MYIKFKSLNNSAIAPGQYIDWIVITSNQDVAVKGISVEPAVTACDIRNKDIKVVIQTKTAQAIDFTADPTSIKWEIWSGTMLVDSMRYPLTGTIVGNSSKTFTVASGINFVKGTYQIKAYLTKSVDNNPSNDRDSIPLLVNPAIMVTGQTISGNVEGNCLPKNSPIQQDITVTNTGNMNISEVIVTMELISDKTNELLYDVFRDTQLVNLSSGGSAKFSFLYTVPTEKRYWVDINAYMKCDSALVNNRLSLGRECVDLDDIMLSEFVSPQSQSGVKDVWGDEKVIAVKIKNLSEDKDYSGGIIRAWIQDMSGALVQNEIPEVLSPIDFGDSTLYTFVSKYKVPKLSDYTVKVFIDKYSLWDRYQMNDTITQTRKAEEGNSLNTRVSDVFTLGQNIPNPAKNTTMIEYSIPSSGEVLFTIQTVSGQILQTQTLQSESGKHAIELNTNDFAAGIYFYSMEYKGQKFVKRMSVKK